MEEQAQLAALLGPDPGPFSTLISNLMSSSNDLRSQAEQAFNLLKKHDPNTLSLKLARLIQSSPQSEARAMSAILLRKLLTLDDYFFWRALSPQKQSSLNTVDLTRDDSFLWPALSPKTQSSLKSVLLTCVRSEQVKSILKQLCDTVSGIQESSLLNFAQLSLYMGEGTEPSFLMRQLVNVVGLMLRVAEAESLEERTRHLAIEFVVRLAEAREWAPGMKMLPQFISRLFAILMKMLLDIEDDPAWHTADTEDEDAGETSNYGVGQECLGRLAIALGGNTIVPVASKQLPAFLAAPEWQKHHAALIALAQIAKGCSKVMIQNLERVVSMVLNSFCDPHPRVRWAAINAVGQLSTDLGPDLQNQFHQRVLLELAPAMDDFQNPRVQAHAASAVLNFSENCTQVILKPYLNAIVRKLLVLLQNGKQMVQEGARTALASFRASFRDPFRDIILEKLLRSSRYSRKGNIELLVGLL